jgi:hypothetical protein
MSSFGLVVPKRQLAKDLPLPKKQQIPRAILLRFGMTNLNKDS